MAKQAKRWSKKLTDLVKKRTKATGDAKKKIQKAINGEYSRLGLNSKGELVKKKLKTTPVKKKKKITKKLDAKPAKKRIITKTAEDFNKPAKKKGTAIPKSVKIRTKAKAYRETEEWARKNKLAPKRKKK